MATLNTSFNESLTRHIMTTNSNVQKVLSAKSIPLWINPNNSNFYVSNPYKAGDIVVVLSNVVEIYSILKNYFENIAENIGEHLDFFYEKNNPELKSDITNVLLNGGYLTEDKYINAMTVVSNSEKGYGLFVSLKNQNYDIPGSSDSWFNLDMSESLDSVQLQISRIISILTSNEYTSDIKEPYIDPETKYTYYLEDNTYFQNRLEAHKEKYHFGDGMVVIPSTGNSSDNVEKAFEELSNIQKEIESNTNTTTSLIRNPFILNGKIIGSTITVIQTTGQMFFYCILDATKLKRDTNITVQFTPNETSNIIVPFVLNTSKGLLTVNDPLNDDYVKTESGDCAWYTNSFVSISSDIRKPNNITLETVDGFEDANFNNTFIGFMDDTYIATYTPIGSEIRTENIGIHCSSVKEISRTTKSLTFQLTSDYVWKYSAIAIALSGKCGA